MTKRPYETPLIAYADLTCRSGICIVSNKNYPDSENDGWDREVFDWED